MRADGRPLQLISDQGSPERRRSGTLPPMSDQGSPERRRSGDACPHSGSKKSSGGGCGAWESNLIGFLQKEEPARNVRGSARQGQGNPPHVRGLAGGFLPMARVTFSNSARKFWKGGEPRTRARKVQKQGGGPLDGRGDPFRGLPCLPSRPCRAPRRCRSGRMRIHFYWIPGRSDQLRSVPACNLPITCQALPRRASDRCARCRCRLPSGRWKGQGLTSSGKRRGCLCAVVINYQNMGGRCRSGAHENPFLLDFCIKSTRTRAPAGAPGLPMCRGDKLSEHGQLRGVPCPHRLPAGLPLLRHRKGPPAACRGVPTCL